MPLPTPDTALVLEAAEAVVVEVRQAEFTRLRIARDWALANPPDPAQLARNPLCARALGVSGLLVTQCVEGELGACLEIHALTALRLMADAVDIETRLPAVWNALADLRLEVWVARKIAAATSRLSRSLALWVDGQIAELLGSMPAGRLLKVVEARVVEADQELADQIAAQRAELRGFWLGRDEGDGNRSAFARGSAVDLRRFEAMVTHLAGLLREHGSDLEAESTDELRARAFALLGNPLAALKLLVGAQSQSGEPDVPEVIAEAIRTAPPTKTRPRTTCYVHLTPDTLRGRGVARAEELGSWTRLQLIDFLAHEHVTLKPVIDLNTEIAADAYEVPADVGEQTRLARPVDCFPYATSISRRQDRDHTDPYRPHGPPGQTRLSNLGHLVRRHHLIKTHAGWRVWQHRDRFFWITPHGRIYITDSRGTHRLDLEVGTLDDAVRVALDYTRTPTSVAPPMTG